MPSNLDAPIFAESAYALNGRQVPIPVGAAAIGTSVPLHTATNDPDEWDVVVVECSNNGGAPKTLGIQWGGGVGGTIADTTSTIVPNGQTVVAVDRRRVRGGLQITGWEGTASGFLTCYVQVDRYREPRMPVTKDTTKASAT